MGEKKFIGNENGFLNVEEERKCLSEKKDTTKFQIIYVSILGNIYEKCSCVKKKDCVKQCKGFTQKIIDENMIEDLKIKYKIEVWNP